MADGVWKGVYPLGFGRSRQLLLNKFADSIIPTMRASKIQNGRQGLQRGGPLGFGALPSDAEKVWQKVCKN